jgi:hypothetical protein
MKWSLLQHKKFERCLCFLVFLISLVATPALAQNSKSKIPSGPATLPASFHEDLNSLKLDTSNLAAEIPVPGEKDDDSGKSFIRERFQLQWRPDDRLDLYIVRPRGVANPPVVLSLYSFPQDTQRFKDDGWCTRVTSEGFAAVGFVSALTGHRYRDRPATEWFVSELKESLVKSTHDVQMILNHLAEHEKFDMDHIGMFAQGSGATIAILASSVDPRIRVLHLVTPWGDWPDWFPKASIVPNEERANYLKPSFLAAVAPLDPIRTFSKVKAKQILLQDLRADAVTPAACEPPIEKAAPARTQIDQFGDGRAYAMEFGGGKLFDWMKSQLKPNLNASSGTLRTQRVRFYPPKEETVH